MLLMVLIKEISNKNSNEKNIIYSNLMSARDIVYSI